MSFEDKLSGIEVVELFPNSTRKTKISGTVDSNKQGQRRIVLLDRRNMAIIGSAMSFPDNTWSITTEFPLDENLVILCFDETGEYNADAYDRVSLCHVQYQFDPEVWKDCLMDNKVRYRNYLFPCVHRDKFAWETQVLTENIRGSVRKFKFDTALSRGRFEDGAGQVVKIGRHNNSKVVSGSAFDLPVDTSFIKRFDGDGDAVNSVRVDRVIGGYEYTDNIFGDGSCIMFYPLIEDFRDRISGNLPVVRNLDFNTLPLPFDNVRYVTNPDDNRYGMIDTGVRLPMGNYTFSFWANVKQRHQLPALFGQLGSFYLGTYLQSNAFNMYRASSATGYNYTSTYPGILPTTNVWDHAVISWDTAAGVIKYYHNGILTATAALAAWIEHTALEVLKATFCIYGTSDQTFRLGNTTSISNYRCLMWRVFNRTVTDAEALILANERPTFLGRREVSKISNVLNKYNSVFSIENAVDIYSTALVSARGNNRPLLHTPIESFELKVLENANHQKCIYKGGAFRKHYIKAFAPQGGLTGSSIDNIFSDALYTNGWGFTWKLSSFSGEQWITLDLERKRYVSGVSLMVISGGTLYDYPTKLDIYSSDTGLFKGEEKFRGQVSILEGYLQSQYTNVGRTESPFHARHIKLAIRDRTYDRTTSLSSGSCYFQGLVVEVLEPYSKESKKARTIIVDIENNWGNATHVGLRSICPILNDMPISTEDWEFYETSKIVDRNGADRVFNGAYPWSHNTTMTHPTMWRSAAGQVGNQRLIGVAPEDFYFDDIFALNYHLGFSADTAMGARNVTVSICPDEYTDITYGAAIPNGQTVFKGPIRQVYTSGSGVNSGNELNTTFMGLPFGGQLTRLRKSVRVRSVVLDFSGNHGHLTQMGFRRVEFFLGGIRHYINTLNVEYTQVVHSSGTLAAATAAFAVNHSVTSTGGWYTTVIGPGRLGIVFMAPIEFDMIRVLNQHSAGADTHAGVSDITIYGSMDSAVPPNVYGAPWEGSFTIIPFTELRRFYEVNTTLRSHFAADYLPIFPRKRDCWSARSVVFDFPTNHGGRNIGVQQIQFLRHGIAIPYKTSWNIFESGSDTNYPGVGTFRGAWNPDVGAVAQKAWRHSNRTSGRLVVVFDSVREFDEIRISNWWDTTITRYDITNSAMDAVVTITNSVLTAEHGAITAVIPGAQVIERTELPLREDRYNFLHPSLWVLARKDTELYSWDIDFLLHSDAPNNSTVFADSSNNRFPVVREGEVKHTTAQAKIGGSSIDVSGGYLRVPALRRLYLGNRAFEMSGYIYPLTTTGNKGILSNWLTADKGFMLSINEGKLEFSFSVDGAIAINCTSNGVVPINQWTGFCVRRDAQFIYIEFDNVLDSSHDIGFVEIKASKAEWLLGSYEWSLSNCFNGLLDEIMVKSSLMRKTETLPLVPTTTLTSSVDPFIETYAALSFDAENKTFHVWEAGAWVPVLTCDAAVHGVAGDADWYYRAVGSGWVKNGFADCMEGFSCALEQNAANRVPKSVLEGLSSAQWEAGGFDKAKGIVNVLVGFYKEGKTHMTLEDFLVNHKRYWFSEPVELARITDTIKSTKTDWHYRYTEANKTVADDFVLGFKVFYRITGDTQWRECVRGGGIPGLEEGTETEGKILYIKTELDIAKTKYPRADTDPVIMVEIN